MCLLEVLENVVAAAVSIFVALTNLTRPSMAGGSVVMRFAETLDNFLELGLTRCARETTGSKKLSNVSA